MKRYLGLLYFIILSFGVFGFSFGYAEELRGRVVEVYDGDTFELDSGAKVRLLDINTPEVGRRGRVDEPLALAARELAAELISGSEVRVVLGIKPKDKYKRYLGQVYLPDGRWVNGAMVRAGLGHVYSFADNADRVADLLPLERLARLEKKGIWSTTRWGVREALDCCPAEDIGRFVVVQGAIQNVVETPERWFFNFGVRDRKRKEITGEPVGLHYATAAAPSARNDGFAVWSGEPPLLLEEWQRDYSFYILKRDLKWFKRAGIASVAAMYGGKHVMVRGFLEPVNGVLVRVTHPAQLELMGGK